jgi:23S rRNA pseudouridine1911/1915/1917 synthase
MGSPITVYRVGESDRGKRLDLFLKERIPKLSRTRIQEVIRARVSLSWGAPARPSTTMIPGGEVRLGTTPTDETPLDLEIPVIARGDGWLAVDKPAGIPVHPVNREVENTVIRMVRRGEGREGLRLVHRLDRETSGVLLLAEDPDSARALSTCFERGEVRKEYLALVRGVVEGERGEIDLPIGDDQDSRVYVRRKAGVGKPAYTEWRVERRLEGHTLLRLFPKTGKRHQLRVHLAALGHPIFGDALYGRPDADYLDMVRGIRDPRREAGEPDRHLLHCAVVAMAPPGYDLRVEADLPPDFLTHLGTVTGSDPSHRHGTGRDGVPMS